MPKKKKAAMTEQHRTKITSGIAQARALVALRSAAKSFATETADQLEQSSHELELRSAALKYATSLRK